MEAPTKSKPSSLRSRFIGAPFVRVSVVNASPRVSGKHFRRRRGRAAIITGIIIFLAIQFGFDRLVRDDLLPLRDPVYSEKREILGKFLAGGSTLDVMALGSSRTQLAFDAQRYARLTGKSAFNFGCPAAGPMTAALYWRRLLHSEVQPREMFVEIHPGFLTDLKPPLEANWLHENRLRDEENDVLRGFGWDLPPTHNNPLNATHRYRFSLLNLYWPRMLPCPYGLTVGTRSDHCGYVTGIDTPANDKPRALARSREQYAAAFDSYHIGGPGVAAIRDTLQQCAGRGVRTTLLLMPESSEFRGWYGVNGRAVINAWSRALAKEFHATLIDAREWVPDVDFADGHHLTQTGAEMFTDRLARTEAHPISGVKP